MHSIRPYPNELFSAFSFIGFILCCIPLPLHLRAGRTYTVLYMVWVGLSCLNVFINSIVWNGNAINWAPVWCDISTKFIVGSSAAIPGTLLCITHHLYLVSHASHASFTKREKRNELIFDLVVGVGVPILQMILQYVVQGHRFNILEDIGCYPASYTVAISFPIVYGVPVLISLGSVTYGVLTIRTLRKGRKRFNDLLQHSPDSNVNSNHYVRLMLLAAVDIVGEITLNVYFIVITLRGSTIYPWISWASVHSHFSRVLQFPVLIWRSFGIESTSLDTTRWVYVACAFLFFGFFGFSEECMAQYRSVFVWLRTKAGFSPSPQAACTTRAPMPQMKFKTHSLTGSDEFHSSPSRTSVVTLPEPALARGEFEVDLDVSSSVGQQNHAMIAAPLGVLHPSTIDASSNV